MQYHADPGSITREWHRLKGASPRTTISDTLSSTLNNLQNELEVSDLYENLAARRNVLSRAIPKTLVDKVGLDELMRRLPEAVSRPLLPPRRIEIQGARLTRAVPAGHVVGVGVVQLRLPKLDAGEQRRFLPLFLQAVAIARSE